MILGINVFVVVLVLLVILTIFAGVKTVGQGYAWTGWLSTVSDWPTRLRLRCSSQPRDTWRRLVG